MTKRLLIDGSQPVVEITCQPNTELDAVIILKDSAKVKCVAHLQTDSVIRWHSAVLGGNVQCEIVTHHQGDGSKSEHRGIFMGRQHNQFQLNYWNTHHGQQTVGHITIHGVLWDAAYTDFKGNVKISPSGKHTVASLTEHTLLLGDKARSDAIPQLDIQTNAVQVTHSSGMSRLDQEQLFYCASRGIPPAQAEQMIVAGFLAECINDQAIEQLCTKLISPS